MKAKAVILIVDDQPQNIELLEAYLSPHGYEIVQAANGEEALGKLSGNQIDLILLDVMMPGMDGFEVTRRVRKNGKQRLIPIILVSGLKEKEDRVKGIEAGCDDFISKPVDKMELLARVRSLLKVKAYNDLMINYRNELETTVNERTQELKKALENLQQDIVKRKLAEEELKERESKYRLLADNIDDVLFVLDINLNYTYVSPAVKSLMGYEPEELLRLQSCETMTPSSWDLAVKTLSEFMDMEKSGKRENKAPQMFQLEMKRKDGSTVWTEVKVSFIRDENERPLGMIGVSRDITNRKMAEEKLRVSEEKYRMVVENAKEAIIVTQDMQVVFVNRAGLDMIGYSEKVLKPQPIIDFIHPDDINRVADHHKRRLNGENIPPSYSFRIVCRDKTVKCVEINAAVIQWKERPATLNFLNDITERKRSEEKLLVTFESLKKAFGTIIQVMITTVEMRDPYTAGHQKRVADLACAIATEMGLAQEKIEGILMAGAIHDIGKLSIPAEILSKPTKLTNNEFNLIKEHSQSGYEMLKNVESPWPLAQIVYQHHERTDGSGYPQGLKGDEILPEARIMAVADVVEAMASHRPYRAALGIEIALKEIEKNRGILYDDATAAACLRLFREKGYKLPA